MKKLKTNDNSWLSLLGQNKENAWKEAVNRIDFPVKIVPAFWLDEEDKKDPYKLAEGQTNSGKENIFNLVLVDKEKDGNFRVVTCANGVYDTLKTDEVYNSLKDTLDSNCKQYHLKGQYVSANGGNHQLVINIDDKFLNTKMLPNSIMMQITLVTSVDRSKGHTMLVRAYDKKNDVSIQFPGSEFNLKARHTNTIDIRTIDFNPFLENVITNWDKTLMPMMNLLCDTKFERDLALNLLEKIMKNTDLAEVHVTKIKANFSYNYNGKKELSFYDLNYHIQEYVSKYIEPTKRDLSDKIRRKVAAKVFSNLKKYSSV